MRQNLGINFVHMYLESRNAFHTKVAESDAPKSRNKFCPHVSGIFDPTFYESRLAPLAARINHIGNFNQFDKIFLKLESNPTRITSSLGKVDHMVLEKTYEK